MKLKKLKPLSNSNRHTVSLQKNLLTKKYLHIKNLEFGLKSSGGRNFNTGRITVRHQGNGLKKKFKEINFTNNSFNAVVISVIYDSNRTSFVSLNFDLKEKKLFYLLNTNKVYPGTVITSSVKKLDLKLGCRSLIKNIPAGSIIHSLSESKKKISSYIRSAGTFGQIIQKTIDIAKIKLPSNKIIECKLDSFVTIGTTSNILNNKIVFGKAGRCRLLGKRPSVRGIAMNPVDHPHGGRTNGGCHFVTPWGFPTKGKPTTKKRK